MEHEKKEEGVANKVEKEQTRKNISKKERSELFDIFPRCFFSTLLVISPSLFSDSIVPLFLGSYFSSLFFTSFLYDLQPLPSRPCAWHMMWNYSWEVLPSLPLSKPSQVFKWSQNICRGSGVRSHKGNKHLDWCHPLQPPYWGRVRPFSEVCFQIFLKLLWSDLELVLNQCDLVNGWSLLYDRRTIFVACWDHLGMILRSLWDDFGIILRSIWDRFGIVLGSFWDRFGIVLGTF